ncbi:MAG: FadR/GntR family transcriptional regulator [Planctomycetaceae bacterium]|jgi:DNA-binding FadR family transcriptional regulator
MKTVRRPKVRDHAAQQIRQYIVARRLAPGDRLPTESQLADSLGISRLSVREATKSLEYLGIVTSKTGVGLTVGRLDMGRVTEHLGLHAGLLDVDPRQLIDSRCIVEVGVLPVVLAKMASDPLIEQQLRAVVAEMETAADLKTRIALDIAFHRHLLEASGLQPLVAFGDLLHLFFQRFRENIRLVEWELAIAGHRRILDALAQGDLASATTELRQHIESHREHVA